MEEIRIPRRRHTIMVVSDGTGITGERVVQAAMTQFDPESVSVERIGGVRSPEQISEVIARASERGATVLYSLVSVEDRRQLLHEARRHDVSAIDLLGPILRRLTDVLAVSPRSEAGLFRQLEEEHVLRVEAVNFAVKHDDGNRTEELDQADLVLAGVSRTSKTPLSMFLAYRCWRVANVPIVLGIEPPTSLFAVDRSKVIALSAQPAWLAEVRSERARRMAPGRSLPYAEHAHVRDELAWFRDQVLRGGWTTVDVTHKAVEETASEIVTLMRG